MWKWTCSVYQHTIINTNEGMGIHIHGQQPDAQYAHCSAEYCSPGHRLPGRSSLPRAVIHSNANRLVRCSSVALRTLVVAGMAIGYKPDSFPGLNSHSSSASIGLGCSLTRTSIRSSSGMSVSLAPWNLGITSCASHAVRLLIKCVTRGGMAQCIAASTT